MRYADDVDACTVLGVRRAVVRKTGGSAEGGLVVAGAGLCGGGRELGHGRGCFGEGGCGEGAGRGYARVSLAGGWWVGAVSALGVCVFDKACHGLGRRRLIRLVGSGQTGQTAGFGQRLSGVRVTHLCDLCIMYYPPVSIGHFGLIRPQARW